MVLTARLPLGAFPKHVSREPALNPVPAREHPDAMSSSVIVEAASTGVLQAAWNVVMSVLLVVAEFAAVALIVAPRAVFRKLRAVARRLVRRVEQTFGVVSGEREPAHSSGRRT
jgi:hypothetical protein